MAIINRAKLNFSEKNFHPKIKKDYLNEWNWSKFVIKSGNAEMLIQKLYHKQNTVLLGLHHKHKQNRVCIINQIDSI